MRNQLYLFILTLCVAVFYSCEYEPKDIFERETIANPPQPVVQSVNLDLNADTIFINPSDLFMYDFSSNNKINSIRFTLDNTEQYTGSSLCNSFSFVGGSPGYGLHTLKAEIFVSSGSKSIADISGAEGYVMTKSWVLKVGKNYASQTYARAEDGYLHIYWPTYTGSDFVDYSIYRLVGPSIVLIKKQATVGFIDKTYVGEGDNYYIRVNRKANNNDQLAWGEIDLQSEIPKAKLIVQGDNQYYFAWNKSKYYKAVDSYKVVEDMYYSTAKVVKTTQDPEDTTYHITSSLFGETVNFNLQVIPREGNLNYIPSAHNQYVSTNDWGYLGHMLKSSNGDNLYTITQVNRDEFVFVQNEKIVTRYSTTQKKIVETKSIQSYGGNDIRGVNVSTLNKYVSVYLPNNNKLVLMNPANFNESASYDLSPVAPYVSEVVVSDNDIGVISYNYSAYVWDLKNKKLLGTYNSINTGYGAHCKAVSSNGDYMLINDNSFRLMKFQAPNFTQVWVYPNYTSNPPKYCEFHALNPEQLAYWDGRTFYIKRCSDFSTVSEFPLNDSSLLNIDYYNNKMLCYNKGHLVVRSLVNGSLLKDIPVNIIADSTMESCYLVNNVIVSLVGVMYFLD